MKVPSQIQGRIALVTGGSTGIGAAIAKALARDGVHLVLVSRNADQLEAMAIAIRNQYGVSVRTVPLDLSEAGAVAVLLNVIRKAEVEIELLVNSAGMVSDGAVSESDPASLRRLVDLNVGALTELSAEIVTQMVLRGHGSIVNIGSVSAYTPTPTRAAYAASKAYVLSFTQALSAEVKDKGVRVVAVSPGPTQTIMGGRRGRRTRRPEQVALTVMAALTGSAPAVVDGKQNRLVTILMKLMPPPMMARIVNRRTSARNDRDRRLRR